jgi:hypothetical protein
VFSKGPGDSKQNYMINLMLLFFFFKSEHPVSYGIPKPTIGAHKMSFFFCNLNIKTSFVSFYWNY